MKTCSRCHAVKPIEAFRQIVGSKDGRDSWCLSCHQDRRNQWQREHLDYKRAAYQLDKGAQADPLIYTRHACKHIAKIAQQAITKFESKTHQEAAPQLTAILELATQFADELKPPPKPPRILLCAYCNTPFQSYMPHATYCSPRCKWTSKNHKTSALRPPRPPKPPSKTKIEQQARKERRESLLPITQAQALARDIEANLIRIYRAHGVKWQTIADTFGYTNPGSVYTRAHPLRSIR